MFFSLPLTLDDSGFVQTLKKQYLSTKFFEYDVQLDEDKIDKTDTTLLFPSTQNNNKKDRRNPHCKSSHLLI